MKLRVSWYSLVSFCVSVGFFASARAATHEIMVSDFAFNPGSQTVSVGDTVSWMNMDPVGHTATANNGSFNVDLPPGGGGSFTFNTAGTFGYFCGPHPFMTGTIIVQGAPTSPPTVSITSPVNNATFAGPGNVTITATASATGGTISKVEFFDGTDLVGTDSTAPYSVTVNLGAGPHALTAKATDSNNLTTTSSAVNVTVGSGGTPIANPIPAPLAKGNITIELQTVAQGMIAPLGLADPKDGSGRLFVYDQAGFIYVISNGVRLATAMLDVRSRMVNLSANYDERGLLGVATHPGFATNGLIYTYTSEPVGPMADLMIMGITNNHQSVIAEWKIAAGNSNQVDVASRREVMRIDKPQSNHNGGTMRFGPDGLLYIAVGDGGAADDQGAGHSAGGNGQDLFNGLGKVLRIDVNGRNSANGRYGIPTDNPFVNTAGAVKEIYAFGFRNPWAFSFDRQSGQLWLGDVGQNHVEEVDVVVKGGNYGWPIKEGSFFFDPNGAQNGFVTTQPVRPVPPDLVEPVGQYDHDEGVAVIGGFMYRGGAISSLAGKYVTGDWGRFNAATGRLFYLDGSEMKELRIGTNDRPLGYWLKGMGEDSSGELYVFVASDLGPSGSSGRMLKIVPAGGTAITNPIPAKIAKGDITIELQTVAEGMIAPLGTAVPNDNSGRVFVYDQAGLIYVLSNNVKLATPLLDVRSRLINLSLNYDERGLIGAATHPGFATNGLIYTYTSEPVGPAADLMIMGITNNHQSVIAEWKIDASDSNRIDVATRREVLRIDKPQGNHNGGTMRFGPDGMLYIAVGDGGAADDQGPGHSPGGNGQDVNNALGKVLRINVDTRDSWTGKYGIPQDNPFIGQSEPVKEIYAWGFRNPYAFSFDRQTGDLWLGDVGQNHVEEIDRVTKGGNYGWPIKEGGFFFDPNGTNNGFVTTIPVREVPSNLVEPVGQYDHDEGVAIIGGFVYRGSAITNLVGKYVTGDWGLFSAAVGRLFYLDGAEVKELRIGANDRSLGHWLKGFGEDGAGELYVFASTNLGPTGTSGKMMKLVSTNVATSLSITSVARQGNELALGWDGGAGSFIIESKTNVTAATWSEAKTVTGTNATTVPIAGGAGFFRVRVGP